MEEVVAVVVVVVLVMVNIYISMNFIANSWRRVPSLLPLFLPSFFLLGEYAFVKKMSPYKIGNCCHGHRYSLLNSIEARRFLDGHYCSNLYCEEDEEDDSKPSKLLSIDPFECFSDASEVRTYCGDGGLGVHGGGGGRQRWW